MVEVYVGLDVSDKSTHLCVVDSSGGVIWSGACATDPDVIARTLKSRAVGLQRVILETGALSAFLYHGLVERGVPVICVCARHARGVLSARVNKSDPHDAEGLAQMARTGWFKAVRIKGEATHMDRARLKIREQLIASRQAIAGQLRGLLKLFGLRMGQVTTPAKRSERLKMLFAQRPELKPIMTPLIESLEALEVQIVRSTRPLAAQAAADPVTARLMIAPGVGPITALVFKSSIEDPARFSRGDDAGAFVVGQELLAARERVEADVLDVTGGIRIDLVDCPQVEVCMGGAGGGDRCHEQPADTADTAEQLQRANYH